MIPKIYISIPVSIDWKEVAKLGTRIAETGIETEIDCWNRKDRYSTAPLINCDVFIFMTPDNDWQVNLKTLPSGVYKELTLALKNNKPVFLAYKNVEGQYNMYPIKSITTDIYSGVAGESTKIWDFLKKFSSIKGVFNASSKKYENPMLPKDCFDAPKESDNTIHFDPRLLL